MDTPPLLIITRPRLQAEALALRLQIHQIHSFIFPLLEIQPTPDQSSLHQAFAHLDQFSLTIFISPTAIDLALSAYQQMTGPLSPSLATQGWPTPIAVMGHGSVTALAKWGITSTNTQIISPSIDAESFDSEELLRTLAQSNFNFSTGRQPEILMIQGHQGRELLKDHFHQIGCRVSIVPLYQRAMPQPDPAMWDTLAQHLHRPHCWLLTSSEAVRNLIAMQAAHTCLKNLLLALVPHPRIAQAATQAGFRKLIQIKVDDDNLLYTLRHQAPDLLQAFLKHHRDLP